MPNFWNDLWFYRDPVERLHHEVEASSQWLRYSLRSDRSIQDFRAFEWAARDRLIERLEEMGLRANLTTSNCPFDLWVEGVKVELKAARYYQGPKGGRYQACIRNYEADLVIFDCVNGADHWHIIPMTAIEPRTSLAVWSYDPARSAGQWRPYLERWDYLRGAIETANHTWQPALF